ncbi:MAG: hypothetical protein K6F33_03280 [Bacteroidales bacterium]|nr:hypothetical protein [Bacteroidales bacterium]
MKRLLIILTITTCLLSCETEDWLPNGNSYPYYLTSSNDDRSDDDNKEIIYLKVYNSQGLMKKYGAEGDSVQLPKKIVADDDKYHFEPDAGFTTPKSTAVYDLNYIKRRPLVCWNTKPDGSGDTIMPGGYAHFGRHNILYAMCKKEYITISFESDYSVAPEPISIEKYSYIVQPSLPLLQNIDELKFVNWLWNGEDFYMIYDLDEDVTLTAHYGSQAELERYILKQKQQEVSPTGQPINNSDITAPETFRASSGLIIDRKNCTITKNGKTYKLYGKYQIVNSFPDLKVQYVNSFPDLKIQKVSSFPDKCGEFQKVNSFPDIKIQIVKYSPDIQVKEVSSWPGF